jgi:hypothetical protein
MSGPSFRDAAAWAREGVALAQRAVYEPGARRLTRLAGTTKRARRSPPDPLALCC